MGSTFLAFWLRTIPTGLLSGGINSPFLGIFSALLLIIGVLLQTQIRTWAVLTISGFNIVAWEVYECIHPISPAGTLPGFYTASILLVCVAGVAVCLRALFETELQLTNAAVESSKQLAVAGDHIAREEAANVAKITFLANVSHELRTPLGAILGYTELLRDEDFPKNEKDEFLETIFRNATQLARLVNDLLDLSKAEVGKIQLEILDFDARNIFSEVLETFHLSARNKNLGLHLEFETPSVSMQSDPNRLKQILVNLIGNAIKFTAAGDIRIRVATEQRAGGNDHWLVAKFRDQGRGIASEEIENLFKPFAQADPSVARKYGGTGLGLHLSRQLAQTLGGSLTLSWAKLGEGCEFLLEVPLSVNTSIPDGSGTRIDPQLFCH